VVVGREVVEKAGGDVILVDLVPGHSTTAIVERAQPVKQPVND
jgi:D-beta-D-heptose 7-phosphate kinase/D-beta-D-heptose 1-phosphate adenosyltransferase